MYETLFPCGPGGLDSLISNEEGNRRTLAASSHSPNNNSHELLSWFQKSLSGQTIKLNSLSLLATMGNDLSPVCKQKAKTKHKIK